MVTNNNNSIVQWQVLFISKIRLSLIDTNEFIRLYSLTMNFVHNCLSMMMMIKKSKNEQMFLCISISLALMDRQQQQQQQQKKRNGST
ncbi:hypothetical protein DERP_004308 [Dermatophagoides pteronyssinus]|uniref:Uncharacterized protein n=1 Tax=Dermatophagoides pteronyssinus TaxID=6956 RepID=A0ABQ8JND9_DERPT|nr:hypothetical protein DERP_004308 [Dermatophagoides pteronyssinus]